MVRAERKEREFNMRRAEILTQAEKIFAMKGFHNVTMAEIAEASGFSIGSLYQFFKGKEDLYTTMVGEKLDSLYAEVRKAPEDIEDMIGKIEALIDAHLQFVEKNKSFLLIFIKGEITSLSEDMEAFRQKSISDYYSYITFIQNLLQDGINKGVLRDLPARDMAEALFYLIRASAVTWMLTLPNESIRSKKEFIMEMFLHGVKKNE